jgi:hypothetical protein
MTFVNPHDRVLDTSTSNSQTVFALSGSGLDTSYNTFSASMSAGDTTIGGVVEPGVAFVSGILTYSATNQITVTTAFENKGTFSSGGTKQVFMGLPGSIALASTTTPQGRLTLASGTAITTADETGQTSVFWTPVGGGAYPWWNGTRFVTRTIAELTLALDSNSGHTNYHASGHNYDFFLVNDGGTDRLVTGPKWDDGAGAGSDTARGTGAASTELQWINGIPVNKNAMTGRFGSSSGNTVSIAANAATCVGTGRMTADGQIEDSQVKRFVWNAYNQTLRPMVRRDPSLTWTYSTDAFHQANANSANQIEFVCGLAGCPTKCRVASVVENSTSTRRLVIHAIGIDATWSTTAATATMQSVIGNETFYNLPTVQFNGYAGLGYHKFVWLERGAGADTQTWVGSNSGALTGSGIAGEILG